MKEWIILYIYKCVTSAQKLFIHGNSQYWQLKHVSLGFPSAKLVCVKPQVEHFYYEETSQTSSELKGSQI